MKYTYLLLFLFLSCSSTKTEQENSEISVTNLSEKEIPKEIKVIGTLAEAKSWQDKNGENILILSWHGPFEEKEYEVEFSGDERYAELFGEQYIKKGDEYIKLWDITNFERHCPFDLFVGFLPNSTTITDLDNNGITETTIIYKLTCTSDISPSRMKLLMHENSIKMGLRGLMTNRHMKQIDTLNFEPNLSKIEYEVDQYGYSDEIWGRYENETDFLNKPKCFVDFARKRWVKYMTEKEFNSL